MDSSCLFDKIANTFGQRVYSNLLFCLLLERLRREETRQTAFQVALGELTGFRCSRFENTFFWAQVSPGLDPCNWA